VIWTSGPLTPNILLTKRNASVQFEGQWSMNCSAIDRKPFWLTRSMWPWHTGQDKCTYAVWGLNAQGCHVIDRIFYLQGQYDLLLTPKSIGSSNKTNLPTKFKGQQPMGSQVIDRKVFLPTRSMWPWPLTLDIKINRCHLHVKTNVPSPMIFEGQKLGLCIAIFFLSRYISRYLHFQTMRFTICIAYFDKMRRILRFLCFDAIHIIILTFRLYL
jgi:hypothetical protein